MNHDDIIAVTRRWIHDFVIGLNLCPFARRVVDGELIRYRVSEATTEVELLDDLERELNALAAVPRTAVETTILIHPKLFADFLDYNDFLESADHRIDALGLRGSIQIASFHPDYRFAGTDADDVENFTNRSPYPMLHLLREASVAEAIGSRESRDEIPERNIALLRTMGRSAIDAIRSSK